MLGQASQLHTAWFWAYNVIIFGGLLASVGASMLRRFVRAVNIWIALGFLVSMVTWPVGFIADTEVPGERPWLWFICTVATAAAAIAFSTWVATVYLVVAPSIYGLIRLTPSGGSAPWDLAALDTVYAILLGGAVLVIITMLRDAAATVDAAQATALARYSRAVRQHATEVERVQVDSIVHDSVLTTLISAARAFSPEAMALSRTMAENAIGHLRAAAQTSPDDDAMVGVEELAERITDTAATLSGPFRSRIMGIGAWAISVSTAEALYSAAVQAMVNSLQHAGPPGTVDRWIRISGLGTDGIEIEVGDNGSGFSMDDVPTERLGLRVSIIERVANAGGCATIVSGPGEGTVVSIRWPDAIDGDDEADGESAL